MARPFKYSLEDIFEHYPNVPKEEIINNRAKYAKAMVKGRKPHTWNKMAGKEVRCQKPGCDGISRRIIDLSDGGIMRYCEYHYEDWFTSNPT